MRKIFYIVLAVSFCFPVFAQDIDINSDHSTGSVSDAFYLGYYNSFYDNFLPGFFDGIEKSLKQRGFPKAKIDAYIAVSKKRITKQDLINETYPCIKKIPAMKLIAGDESIDACIVPWLQKVHEKNKDLLDILR